MTKAERREPPDGVMRDASVFLKPHRGVCAPAFLLETVCVFGEVFRNVGILIGRLAPPRFCYRFCWE